MAEDNWDDYRYVLALYRHGSIAAAARALSVNDTTVARRLSQVECSLGTRLFERERGRVTLTNEAAAVIRRLRCIDDEFIGLRDEASGADRRIEGIVRVTAVPMIANRVLVPRLTDILRRHEHLNVELVVNSARVGIARRRDADIAIRGARPSSDAEAITRKLGLMTYGLYCHRDLLESGNAIDWIAYTPARTNISRPQADWIDDRLRADKVHARTLVNDGESVLQCLLSGVGQSLVADALAHLYPELKRLEAPAPTPSRELWMLIHPSYREVKRIDVVAQWLTDQIQAFLRGSIAQGSSA